MDRLGADTGVGNGATDGNDGGDDGVGTSDDNDVYGGYADVNGDHDGGVYVVGGNGVGDCNFRVAFIFVTVGVVAVAGVVFVAVAVVYFIFAVSLANCYWIRFVIAWINCGKFLADIFVLNLFRFLVDHGVSGK